MLDSGLFVPEFVPPQMVVWVGMKVKKEAIMTAEISLESLRKRGEELDFRRDLIEYTPESFTGDQIIDLLHEQRRICDAMEREVREDFATRSPELQKGLLESLDGAVAMIACGGKPTSSEIAGTKAAGPQPGSRSR